ncbi:MAG: DNA-binding protein [Thermoprotei archaeon]|nr:MAG: DNA-binding protein [Thermoprotei archaeon]
MSYEGISDEELEEIKRRKLLELQRRLLEEERRRKLERELEARKQAILRRILTPKALERLYNVKLIRPDIATYVEEQLIALAQAGRIKIPVDDETLKTILAEIYARTRREFKIRIKEK